MVDLQLVQLMLQVTLVQALQFVQLVQGMVTSVQGKHAPTGSIAPISGDEGIRIMRSLILN